MGRLERKGDRHSVYLPRQIRIGRDPPSELLLGLPSASSMHALLRWDGERWTIRDLNSRNGTYVNGQRVEPAGASPRPLRIGDEIAFAERTEVWTLADDGPPVPLLIGSSLPSPIVLREDTLLAWPSEDAPRGFFYFERGSWRFESTSGEVRLLYTGDEVLIDGERLRVQLPGPAPETPPAGVPVTEKRIDRCHILLRVARDEEMASLRATIAGESFEIPPRVHLYLLVHLARARLRDASASAGADEGWVSVDECCQALDLTAETLALHVHRCRKEFERLGFAETSLLVDRSHRGFLRVGIQPELLEVVKA